MPALTPLYMDTPAAQADLPVTARDLRAQTDGLLPGVVRSGDLAVTAAGLGVAVAPGTAYVSDGQASPTLYRCEWSGSAAAQSVAAPDSSNPRLDQVVARVRDLNLDGGTTRDWILDVLTGTPGVGVTLDNRAGAAALPARALRLADVLVPAGASAIASGNIRDRRSRAAGRHFVWNENFAGGLIGDATMTFMTGAVEVPASGLRARATWHVRAETGTGAPADVALHNTLTLDGTEVWPAIAPALPQARTGPSSASNIFDRTYTADVPVDPGRRTFGVTLRGGTAGTWLAIGRFTLTIDLYIP